MHRTKRDLSPPWWRMTALVWAMMLAPDPCAARSTFRTDPDYLIDTWEAEDGLPGNSATAMEQDPEGYLWIGTNMGLVRWDGVEFLDFDTSNTPGLADNSISAIGFDTRGRMWVGTDRGVTVCEGGIWRGIPLPGTGASPTSRMVFTLTVRADGEVFVTTNDGNVHVSRDGKFETLPPPPGQTGRHFFGGVDETGQWWVANHRFIGKWDGAHWVRMVSLPPDLSEDAIACGPARDGGLWILAGHELRRIRQGAEVSLTLLPDFTGRSTGLHEDSRGQVWISTFDTGLWRVRPGAGVAGRWSKVDGLASNRVHFSFEDREHHLWAGTAVGGLMQFRERTFRSFLEVADRTAPSHFSVTQHPDGGVLLARFGQPIVRADAGGLTPFPLPEPSLSDGRPAYSLLMDRSRRLWVGTDGGGVWVVSGKAAQQIPQALAGGGEVRTLFEDSRGRIWMAGGVSLAVYENNAARGYSGDQGVPAGMVNAFAEDTRGTIWIAHERGVFRLEGERFAEVRDEGGRAIKLVSLLGDAEGGVWMATANDGIRLWKDGNLLQRPLPPEIPVRGLWSLTVDGPGFLWMSTSRGLLRLSLPEMRAWLANGQRPPAWQVFGVQDGLPKSGPGGTNQSAAVRDTEGRLWFTFRLGVAMADPAALRLNTTPPPVPIQSVSHYGASPEGYGSGQAGEAAPGIRTVLNHPFPDRIRFPPGSRRLEVSYAALSFAAPDHVRYQISLASAGGAAWQDAAGRRSAVYYDLPPGDYTFRVRAANNHGIWNETGSALDFSVEPFYWQNPWVRMAGVLTLLALGGGLTWWLMRFRHTRMKEKLALQQQRGELAHFGRVASMGELSGSLAHELNQPLTAILSNAQAAQRFMEQDPPDLAEVREILTDIVSEDRRAGEVIRRMRGMLKKGETVMEVLQAGALAEEVLAMIRSDLVARNISVTTEFAPALPPVYGDRIQLQQVILNLLVNAGDAMADTPAAGRVLTIAASAAEGMVVLTVRDRGHGLEAGADEKIFAPFYTTKTGGLGMGLAICRSILLAHAGRLTAQNHPDGGAVLRMELPPYNQKWHD